MRRGDGRGYHNSVNKRQRPDPKPEQPARERPSKSQLKREMSELQALGERLLALPAAKLRGLPIGEDLIEAVELAQRITAREGLRRQRQYIGRLMRDTDPQPLRDALDADGAQHRLEVETMHAAERWRERLLNETDALARFDAAHPGAGATIAALVAQVRATGAREAGASAHRALYRTLRDILGAEQASTTREHAAPNRPPATEPR
ncbi:MAG: DUF615 domain-containing protein [Burkholderiaceae bacterium]|nr:DUF615 domain-containing protein [Burkholderiaceae bacterium]